MTEASKCGPESNRGTIVVGVDGSESSKEALRWASQQAKLTGAKLRAVMSWELPRVSYISLTENLDFRGEALSRLKQTVSDTLDSAAVDVETVVTDDRAGQALVDESKGADLLVVGSRGHGQFAGMFIGSVGLHCVTRAKCPVTVVRSEWHSVA